MNNPTKAKECGEQNNSKNQKPEQHICMSRIQMPAKESQMLTT